MFSFNVRMTMWDRVSTRTFIAMDGQSVRMETTNVVATHVLQMAYPGSSSFFLFWPFSCSCAYSRQYWSAAAAEWLRTKSFDDCVQKGKINRSQVRTSHLTVDRSRTGRLFLEGDVTVTGEDAGLMKILTSPAADLEAPRPPPQYEASPPIMIDSTKPIYPTLN